MRRLKRKELVNAARPIAVPDYDVVAPVRPDHRHRRRWRVDRTVETSPAPIRTLEGICT